MTVAASLYSSCCRRVNFAFYCLMMRRDDHIMQHTTPFPLVLLILTSTRPKCQSDWQIFKLQMKTAMRDDAASPPDFRRHTSTRAVQVVVFAITLSILQLASSISSISSFNKLLEFHPIFSSIGNNSTKDSSWSAQDLLLRNTTSVFEFLETKWPKQQQSCPFNFSSFVYQDLPRNLTSALEGKLLACFGQES